MTDDNFILLYLRKNITHEYRLGLKDNLSAGLGVGKKIGEDIFFKEIGIKIIKDGYDIDTISRLTNI